MIELDIDLRGFDELKRKFAALTGPQQRDAAQRGLMAGGQYLEAQFKITSPVDTGFMRSAIYVRSIKGSGYSGARSDAMSRAPTREMLAESSPPPWNEVRVIFGAEYTAYVEAKKPFIMPAFRANAKDAAELVRNHIVAFIQGAR